MFALAAHKSQFARPSLGKAARVMALFDVWSQRRALSRLDAQGLADVGLTKSEADREAGRSFWDAPAHWTK